MNDCIFCKIINGEIPSYTIYENDSVLAFLDINPVSDGHTLVIPKQHIRFVHEMEDVLYQNVMGVVKKVMSAIENSLLPTRVGVIVEGFDVDHAHIKVIPLNDPRDIQTPHVGKTSDNYFTALQEKISSKLHHN